MEDISQPHIFSNAGLSRIRNIAFVFSTEQLGIVNYATFWKLFEDDHTLGSYSDLTTTERREMVDGWHHVYDEFMWSRVQQSLCRFTSEIDYVQVDFSWAFCHGGCCRPITRCIDRWIVKLAPKILNVTGVMAGEKEGVSFTYQYTPTPHKYTLDDLKAMYGLHFMQPGELTKWDAWKVDEKKAE